jgi:hypothetical protein
MLLTKVKEFSMRDGCRWWGMKCWLWVEEDEDKVQEEEEEVDKEEITHDNSHERGKFRSFSNLDGCMHGVEGIG